MAGLFQATRTVAFDLGVVVLLATVVAFAATHRSSGAPKAWYYGGWGNGNGYGGGGGYGYGYGVLDTDGDGIPDTRDPDDDNDGVADKADGCPKDRFKASPGACGCGRPDVDVDDDGLADCGTSFGSFWASRLPYAGYGAPIPADLGFVRAVAAGDSFQLALRADGTIRAWGSFGYSQSAASVPESLRSIKVSAIAAGSSHAVVLLEDRSVRQWGAGGWHQFDVPADLPPAIAIAAGGSHSFALTAFGFVRHWGPANQGAGEIPPDLRDVTAIAAGYYHAVALRSNGDVRAWGSPYEPVSVAPPDLGPASAIASGGFHAIALRPDGSIRAWGDNWAGQAAVPWSLGPASAIAAGYSHSVALLKDGSVRAWGGNYAGQVGAITGLRDVIAIAAGGDYSLAIRSTDCDGSSIPDFLEAKAADFDRDGRLDRCEVREGSADCNGDLVPDADQLAGVRSLEMFGEYLPEGRPREFIFSSVRDAVPGGAVEIEATAFGDLSGPGEFLRVQIAGEVLELSGSKTNGNTAIAVVPAAAFNAAINRNLGGAVSVDVRSGPNVDSWAFNTFGVRVRYLSGSLSDCNSNGVPDQCDVGTGASADVDGNGIPDECLPPIADFDGDGIADAIDPDDDNDGVDDQVDAFPNDPTESLDSDGDGLGNNADTNDDNDLLADGIDNCTTVANDDQVDLDLDGEGDACDLDDDNDGAVDLVDNCPATPNPLQTDCDGNGLGDACDAGSTAAGPDIVVDGGFEASSYDGAFQGECFTSGGFTMVGWQHGAGRTEDLYRNTDGGACSQTPGNPSGGQYFLALQGSGCCSCNVNGAIWQPLETELGRTYTLRMQVYLDDFDVIRVSYGAQSAEFAPPQTSADGWVEVAWQFDGTGQPSILRVESIGSAAAPGCLEADYAFVDNIRVTRDALVNDCNGNGVQDLLDIAFGTEGDCDSNCVPDACDQDADGDGVIDACDPCPGKPGADCGGCPANECGECGRPADLDGDGIPDCVDADRDGDDVPDRTDAFPQDPSEWSDTDLDGIGNNADLDDDADGIPDLADNCALIGNPAQEDCDSDLVGDACQIAADPGIDCDGNGRLDPCDAVGGAGDCDSDGVLDRCELSDGAADCNANGVPDACDIEQYVLEDCNENGIGDSCEKQLLLDLESGVRAPLGNGHPHQWVLQSAVRAVDTVHVRLSAKGDLSSLLEYVDVGVGDFVYRAFNRAGPGGQADCAPIEDGFEIPIESFNQLIQPDGSIRVSVTASAAVDPSFCGGDTWISLRISYAGAAPSDCNANGALDTCEIAAGTQPDSDNNGIPDGCVSPVAPCPADFDGDGFVNGADLGAFLAAWAGTNPYFDLDGNGEVNGADLGQLLSAWGVCAE